MQIIISPAKKMRIDNDDLAPAGEPRFLKDTEILLSALKQMQYDELKNLWQCNDEIAALNYKRLQSMRLQDNLTPAVLAYDGIQYQYMAPRVFENAQLDYVAEHLNILSGFYGILKAMDGVVPYRLEMQAKLQAGGYKNLYDFWGNRLYLELTQKDKSILNLASKEYSKAVEKYLTPEVEYVTCVFGMLQEGKIKVKATEAKMARGEMVRWCAEHNVLQIETVKNFDHLGYRYQEDKSTAEKFVFLKG
ncbi:MAG: peroxide stress protein YaaA [Phascolarctobacterium sp.]|uniref:peroxide stress protein YaaA n=1 Tax=Phascolarctobacterium sp. TaxID=2049039 RepID=UPI0025FF7843|nr:peroxide stress protein YaaA [Phascolarctobacterium sp.]MCC8158770.1 peroxide stress protein YaaA [Phascolarctobacterium sp.]